MDAFLLSFSATLWDKVKWLEGGPPKRLDRVGDLVVVDGSVVWKTPELDEEGGGFRHVVPDGTYPVYAESVLVSGYDDEPERYCVETLLILLAEPERLANVNWNDGYGSDAQEFKDYACLVSERAYRATLLNPQHEAIARARKALLSDEARTRRDNWTDEVVDPETGANMLAFPVDEGTVSGFEARSEDDEILAILLVTLPPLA
jgi:hypothetical protein